MCGWGEYPIFIDKPVALGSNFKQVKQSENHKEFRTQFRECMASGFNTKTEFTSFKDHPEYLPALPNKKMIDAIKARKWQGLDFLICGRFGGKCSSANPECRKLRGLE